MGFVKVTRITKNPPTASVLEGLVEKAGGTVTGSEKKTKPEHYTTVTWNTGGAPDERQLRAALQELGSVGREWEVDYSA
jgi:hypothetical protein